MQRDYAHNPVADGICYLQGIIESAVQVTLLVLGLTVWISKPFLGRARL